MADDAAAAAPFPDRVAEVAARYRRRADAFEATMRAVPADGRSPAAQGHRLRSGGRRAGGRPAQDRASGLLGRDPGWSPGPR
jgi:hypothetical protein